MANNTLPFPRIEHIEEQAAAWLSAMDRGLSEAEQSQLEQWLLQSSLHADTLVELAALWDKADALSVISRVMPLSALQAEPAPTKRPWSRVFLGLGAGLATICLLVAVVLSPSVPPHEVYFEQVYQTAHGEQASVTLPDGTAVTLNTSSQIIVRYSKQTRSITLARGEAYFEVAKNPEVPLVAALDQATVTAVGTAFNIQHFDYGYEVVVTEGLVEVRDGFKTTKNRRGRTQESGPAQVEHLRAGQELRVVNDGARVIDSLSASDMEADLAWRQGMLMFRGEPLQQVLAEINRYASLQLIIEDESIAALPVGGLFQTTDTDALLAMLEFNFNLKSRRVGNQLFLAPKP